MHDIIVWCNENEGFVAMVLSIVTILISVIAIVVSINTARLPYKQNLKFDYYIYDNSNGIPEIHMTVVNVGNCAVYVDFISIEQEYDWIAQLGNEEYKMMLEERLIEPNVAHKYVIPIEHYSEQMEERAFDIVVYTTKHSYRKCCNWARG